MIVALSTLETAQANGTESMEDTMIKLLNYCATHLEAMVRHKESDMILAIHRDAFHLYEPKAHIRAGGYLFLTKKPKSG